MLVWAGSGLEGIHGPGRVDPFRERSAPERSACRLDDDRDSPPAHEHAGGTLQDELPKALATHPPGLLALQKRCTRMEKIRGE